MLLQLAEIIEKRVELNRKIKSAMTYPVAVLGLVLMIMTAMLVFVVADEFVDDVVEAIADAARSGNESGDGLVWQSPVLNVVHNRTGMRLEEVEARV